VRQYLSRRLLLMIPVFIGISMIVFALIHTTPGDPFAHLVEQDVSKEDRELMLRQIGYYDPLPIKYLKWSTQALKGNLGWSIKYREPVLQLMKRRLANTFGLSLMAMLLSTLIAIPLGVISATRQYSAFDYIATVFAFIGISIPSFFFALGLIKIFAVDLGWFAVSGMQSIGVKLTGWAKAVDIFKHAFLPLFVLTMIQTASLMRYTRSAMLEVFQQDYIRTARAKGVPERTVVYKHALRNSLIPITTLLTLRLSGLLSGATLTETVFLWPGMGTLIYQAVSNRDYNVITSGVLLVAVSILFCNLLADVLYAFVDPRIRYD
jgi:peptide/nickel transport system permease protein